MSSTELDRLRKSRRASAIFQGVVLSGLTAFTVGMGTLGVNGHKDVTTVTEDERLSAMRTCMIETATQQIREQTDHARTGAIVVIDGGNPDIAPCIDKLVESGEEDGSNGKRFMGGMFGAVGLLYSLMMAFSMTKSMRNHNHGIREQTARDERNASYRVSRGPRP